MKRLFATAACLLSVGLLFGSQAEAQDREIEEPETEKLAQTGFKFLSVSVDARAAAMGDALTASEMGSVSMFYNPAGMARLNGAFDVAGGQTRWIADINYNMAALAFSPSDGRFGVFGVTFVAADYGEIIGTFRADNEQGYEEYENVGLANPSPTALAVGLGYARALTDRFSVGGTVKYASQDLGEGILSGSAEDGFGLSNNSKSTVAVDFGVLYNTGFRSLNFAMSARNFSRELTYAVDNFELPLTFRIGVSMDLMDFTNMDQNVHSLRFALDAERPRDFAEQVKVGTEYLFMNTLALRAGYTYPTDTQGVNLGLGVQQSFNDIGFAFNYAYTTFEIFDNVHRLGFQLSF